MRIEEAKQMYFAYCGNEYWMQREEPAKFEAFRSLRIPDATISRWNAELAEDNIRRLWDQPDRAWRRHDTLLRCLLRRPDGYERLGAMLLDQMEHVPEIDEHQRILIIENMAGQNCDLDNGGVYFFCRYTGLGKRMEEVMEKFMDFPCELKRERLERARELYRKSLQKWSRPETPERR